MNELCLWLCQADWLERLILLSRQL